MSVLVAQGLGKSYGALDVFDGVSCRIEHGDRIGLVGPNGEGKTSLLRILAALDQPNAGQVIVKRGLRIGYLSQDPPAGVDATLLEDLLAVFEPLRAQQAELVALEQRLASTHDGAEHDALLHTYGEIQHAFEVGGGYTYELQVQQVLSGLGFEPAETNKPLAVLSGGERTRARLGRLLLEKPDLLLLDEPTNHLDLEAVEWLEHVLTEWPGSFVVVAHDRYFLDNVATRIWDMARGSLETYRGNYSHYVQQRADRAAARRTVWEAQQEYIAETEAFIRRYKAGQRSKEARGRQTRLERFKRDELIERPHELKTIHLGLTTEVRSGDIVLRTKDLVIGYAVHEENPLTGGPGDGLAGQPRRRRYRAEHALFTMPDVEVRRGQCVALIGPNGSGKTTLLKTIMGEIAPLAGSVRPGASVIVGYLAQASAALRPEQTVLDAILDIENLPIGEARNYLGRFLFSGDDVFKPIATLSGGQRSRVALARLTLEGANFLLLDEPTNHLDLASQEILQDVLDRFPGTVLLVSHDRYLVDALADFVWAIRDGELHVTKGNYQEYLRLREQEQLTASERTVEPTRQEAWLARERTREERRQRKAAEARAAQVDALEAQIHELERYRTQLEVRLDQAGAAQAVDEITSLGQEYQAVGAEIDRLLEAWAALS